MPDRDQGWQKARDQARLAGCIVDMPRGQRWQTAMEQTDQAQGKQNCHWTKQGLHTAGNQVRPTAWIPNHTPWQRKDHSTTRQLDGGLGAIPPGKGVASLLQVYPRMPPLSSSTGSNSISGRHCVFTWDNTCCSYTAGYTLYYTCVHGRRWHVQVSCLYYIRLYNFKSHNLFKEVASQRRSVL